MTVAKNPAKHFRVAAENLRYTWPRTVCGARGLAATGGWVHTRELRETTTVECHHCMVVKDWWLENDKPRLTLRRCRMLLKPVFKRSP